MKTMEKTLMGDLMLLLFFSLILIVFPGFILWNLAQLLPPWMMWSVFLAGAASITAYLIVVFSTARQLMSRREEIYGEG